jgi:dihydrodipicolinate synthase/N-acetylneuraminate lyase
MMRSSTLRPHFAAPFGDMMLAGCYGLLSAVGNVLPELRGELDAALDQQSSAAAAPPWEVE